MGVPTYLKLKKKISEINHFTPLVFYHQRATVPLLLLELSGGNLNHRV